MKHCSDCSVVGDPLLIFSLSPWSLNVVDVVSQSPSCGSGGKGACCLAGSGAGALVAGFGGGRGALCFRTSAADRGWGAVMKKWYWDVLD